jgi:heme/copper-type cytochrome/quinol oxidase subunit 2
MSPFTPRVGGGSAFFVRPQVMSSHFSFLAGSVDIKLPDGAGYAILTAAVVALVVFGILIYVLLKKKKQPDDKD